MDKSKKKKALAIRNGGVGSSLISVVSGEQLTAENDQMMRITCWMDLIEVNSHLNESDQIKGILCNVMNAQKSGDMIHALDLKMAG